MFRTTVGQVTVLGGRQYDGATNTSSTSGRHGFLLDGIGGTLCSGRTPRAEEHETVARQLAEVAQRAYTAGGQRDGGPTAGRARCEPAAL